MQLGPKLKLKKTYHDFSKKVAKLFGEDLDFEKEPSPYSGIDIVDAHDIHFLYGLLDYISYSPKGYFINKDSVGFVIECSPLVGCDELTARNLVGLFQDFLPVHSNLQCML